MVTLHVVSEYTQEKTVIDDRHQAAITTEGKTVVNTFIIQQFVFKCAARAKTKMSIRFLRIDDFYCSFGQTKKHPQMFFSILVALK